MSGSRKLLIVAGLVLAIWGMSYGLYYALFAEHQALDRMGASLAAGFAEAAQRKMPEAHAALDAYAQTSFVYVRDVDVHSHWTGLAMILIVLGLAFDRVGFRERWRLYLAAGLVIGVVSFPLGVFLQTWTRGFGSQVLAAIGAALVICSLAAVAWGFALGKKLKW